VFAFTFTLFTSRLPHTKGHPKGALLCLHLSVAHTK
jgi:hypothetical protein